MKKISFKPATIFICAFSSACSVVPSRSIAQHRDAHAHHVDYRVELHNEYGGHVDFSCNGGTMRDLDHEQSRVIIVSGGQNIEINCLATHNGQRVWSGHLDLTSHNPHGRIVIRRPHDDDH